MNYISPYKRHTRPTIRLWMVGLLLILASGFTYIVVTEEPTEDAPVPSPNFKSEEGLGP